jgi:hypothetical protein
VMKPSQAVYTYGQPVAIDSLGPRGPELREPNVGNGQRIVFIGDSVTYGGRRIAEEQVFCWIVESSARDVGLNVETVNLSAPAWSPQKNWSEYIRKQGFHHADTVAIVLTECDPTRVFSTRKLGGNWDRAPHRRLQSLTMKVLSRFGREQLSVRPHVEDVIAANLSAVVNLWEKCHGIPFIAILIPSGVPRSPDAKLWFTLTRHRPNTLDLRWELQSASFLMDGTHLSVAGHGFVAEKILGTIPADLQSLGRRQIAPSQT